MLRYRKAIRSDADTIFRWSNNSLVRQFSFNSDPILYENHNTWFEAKLNDSSAFFYFFINELNHEVGLVRIERKTNETIIGILVDEQHRGKSYSVEMLIQATTDFHSNFPDDIIFAYIKQENIVSIKSFTKAGFSNPQIILIQNILSVKLTKYN